MISSNEDIATPLIQSSHHPVSEVPNVLSPPDSKQVDVDQESEDKLDSSDIRETLIFKVANNITDRGISNQTTNYTTSNLTNIMKDEQSHENENLFDFEETRVK